MVSELAGLQAVLSIADLVPNSSFEITTLFYNVFGVMLFLQKVHQLLFHIYIYMVSPQMYLANSSSVLLQYPLVSVPGCFRQKLPEGIQDSSFALVKRIFPL